MSQLDDINAEIARYAAMLNKRIARASDIWDVTGIYTQALAKAAKVAERTNPQYTGHGVPKLSYAKQPTIAKARKVLNQYRYLSKKADLTKQQYNNRIDYYRKQLQAHTGVKMSRRTYESFMAAQNSAELSHIDSEQLLRFFEVIDRVPSGSRRYLPFDPSDDYSIYEYLSTTSLPAEKLELYIQDEFNVPNMTRYATTRYQ